MELADTKRHSPIEYVQARSDKETKLLQKLFQTDGREASTS